MYSKYYKLRRGVSVAMTIVAGTASFSGCGLKIGERPNQDGTVQLGSAETACLSGAARTLQDYFRGNTSDKEVSGVFSCASNSLKLFQERTRGSRAGIYTPGELRKFMERYFLRDFTISDGLLAEFMELKKTLLGGTTEELTLEELERLRNLLDTLRDVTVRLRPYLPLNPSHVSELKSEDLENSILALRDAASSLGKILEERASPYRFSHLDHLLGEIEKFLQDDDFIHDTAEFRKYLPIFVSLKKIMVSPDGQQMAGADWRYLLTRAADLYSIMLRSAHLLKNEPSLISGNGRVKLVDLSTNGYRFLHEVINSSPYGTISFCSLFSVIDEASRLFGYQHDLETLKRTNFADYPAHLKIHFVNKNPDNQEDYLWYFKYGDARIYRGTIKQLLLPIVQKILKPVSTSSADAQRFSTLSEGQEPLRDYWNACSTVRGIDYNKSGLRLENLNRLWKTVSLVAEGQRFLEETFYYARKEFGGSGDPLATDTIPASLTGWLNPTSFTRSLEILYKAPQGTLTSETIDSAQVLARLIQNHLPLFKENDPSITFDDTSPPAGGETVRWRQSFVGLSGLNAIWQLVHLTWDGYSSDPLRTEGVLKDGTTGGISGDELEQFYRDTRELGIAFKLYDPTSNAAAKNRFFEGNLFTYASNGDSYLSLAEGTDLVAFLYSGKGLSSKTYRLIHDQCAKWTVGCSSSHPNEKSCHIGGKDVFGMDMISTECFNHFAYGELYQQLWDHMPNLTRFYTALPLLGTNSPDKNTVYRETATCLLETVARPRGSDPKWIGSGDVDQISALTHYLEALFVRFDANHSGSLNRSETLTAYPVLEKVIRDEVKKRVSFLKSDEDIQAVLTYILARGTIPSSQDWKSILDFGVWRYIYATEFEADRARVLQVMAAITNSDVSGCFISPHVLSIK